MARSPTADRGEVGARAAETRLTPAASTPNPFIVQNDLKLRERAWR
jgi:hypothetical protein